MAPQFPNYYEVLGLDDKKCSTDEVRTAYRRESLRTHPDRLPNATPEEKKAATARFQVVADAYYVLSDPIRRREYDALLASRAYSERTSTDPDASSNFFSNFANMFSGAGASAGASTSAGTSTQQAEEKEEEPFGERPDPEQTFANVFEEMLRPEIQRTVPIWTLLGAASGAGLGFIIANIPGALMGGYAGNRLGAIRDAKGKSVLEVFNTLASEQKAEILKSLAFKVLGSMQS